MPLNSEVTADLGWLEILDALLGLEEDAVKVDLKGLSRSYLCVFGFVRWESFCKCGASQSCTISD